MRFASSCFAFGLCFLLGGCATGRTMTDRAFAADHVEKNALDQVAADIKMRAAGPITILVKYKLLEPYFSSKALATEQGNAIKTYLAAQGVQPPMEIVTTPADIAPNQIWISYAGNGPQKPVAAP